MFISLKTIAKLFTDCETAIYGNGSACCLSCFEMLNPSLYIQDKHILYVTGQPDFLSVLSPGEDSHFLYFSDNFETDRLPLSEYPVNILCIRTMDMEFIHHRLSFFFQRSSAYGLFTDSLLESLFYEVGIQAMIDEVAAAFENPIFVFDAGFHLIAATWDMAAKDSVNAPLLEAKAFSENEFALINKLDHIHEKVKKSDKPIQLYNPELKYDQLACAIDTQKDVGHIVINGFVRPFTDGDHHLLILLKRAIDQQLKKNEFIRNSRGFQYEYFIKDLLDEKIAVGKKNYDTLKYVKKEFSGTLYCIVVETARSSSTVHISYVRNEFETRFPGSKTLIYNGEIIILACLPSGAGMSAEQYSDAAAICRKHKIYAGISNAFEDILQVRGYYMQALRAIELGISHDKSPNLYLYGDYYMQHISSLFLQKESPAVFCHPQLPHLIQYDRKNQTDYALTLYKYLINERNSVLAAKDMNLHPNTLRYRLKQIQNMIGVNLDNAHERQYLIVSYEVYKNKQGCF